VLAAEAELVIASSVFVNHRCLFRDRV